MIIEIFYDNTKIVMKYKYKKYNGNNFYMTIYN